MKLASAALALLASLQSCHSANTDAHDSNQALDASAQAQPVAGRSILWLHNGGGYYGPADLLPSDPRRELWSVCLEGYSAASADDPRAFYFVRIEDDLTLRDEYVRTADINAWRATTVSVDGVSRPARMRSTTHWDGQEALWLAMEVTPAELGTHREIEFEFEGARLAAKTKFLVGSPWHEYAMQQDETLRRME